MRTETAITIRREDYRPFPYDIPRISLEFDLDPLRTEVRSVFEVIRKKERNAQQDLVLNGESLHLLTIAIDGVTLDPSRYVLDSDQLIIRGLPEKAEVCLHAWCSPTENTSLMGLYVSGQSLFTQCEAQGFRKIMWFADRPDVMSEYRVTLRADRKRYPVLLSNGNLVSQSDLPDGRHEACWHDPFPKPSYLFALVAGTLSCREHRITTRSGRPALLQVYSDPGSEQQTAWAMESLERAVRWDENRFGLELDLDRFMIVAARDFNMGAMENKGLNIFNAAYVLADPDTATDANFSAIEAVIGHEYFHNWTGNRVTCRDWFQLSLKEGLTVFRDQEFTADMMARDLDGQAALSARAVKRIDDVVTLRSSQFPEDSGPMAHPIRPESYQEIGNFYTATVYEKGAEVIRMMHTLLGEKGFRAGMDEYFRRHDGQAVTCDDFVNAMEWALQQQSPEKNLDVFRRWYRQAGTPRVKVSLQADPDASRLTITLKQSCDLVGVEKNSGIDKLPYHIPFALGLVDKSGKPVMLSNESIDQNRKMETVLLELTQLEQSWTFDKVPSEVTPSLLRNFSAPVTVDFEYTEDQLALLSAHDTNPFTRWEAGQELATRELLRQAALWRHQASCTEISSVLVSTMTALMQDPDLDAAYRARTLSLPLEKTIVERMPLMDPLSVAVARRHVRKSLGQALGAGWLQTLEQNQADVRHSPDPVSVGRRALKNLALTYLMAAGEVSVHDIAQQQYLHATNMTDRMAALTALVHESSSHQAGELLTHFYERWQHDPLVIDKWFALQATAPEAKVATIKGLMAHPAFTLRNPNRARALVFQFCMANAMGFHADDGSGYDFWANLVLELDTINPEIAARFARVMDHWRRHVPVASSRMHSALERVATHAGLSRNVSEIVSKSLSL